MSKATQLLEAAVAEVIAHRPAEGERPTPRQRLALDRAFAVVMKIVAPRIRHFIKQYGLVHHWDDAEQVCAIGVHRAIEAYDPAKAMFTTFVNWQLRGELQGLRFRLMEDQRPSAKKVEATTISLHALEQRPDGEDMSLEAMIEDEGAQGRTEAGAADHMAHATAQALLDDYVEHLRTVGLAQLKRKARATREIAPRKDGPASLPKYISRSARIDPEDMRRLEERIERDRDIVSRHLFGHGAAANDEADPDLTKERIRQITRRAARLMADLAVDNPRFTAQPAVPSTAATAAALTPAPEMPAPAEAPSLLPRGNHLGSPSTNVRVVEPEFAAPEARPSAPVRALATVSAMKH